ncbi:hypothetical protein GCM10027456_19670 [Kineosporia babensis]
MQHGERLGDTLGRLRLVAGGQRMPPGQPGPALNIGDQSHPVIMPHGPTHHREYGRARPGPAKQLKAGASRCHGPSLVLTWPLGQAAGWRHIDF